MKDLFEKWKQFVNNMNKLGIPFPTVRDPKSGFGSISLTLVFLSFNIWVVSIIGKYAGQLGGIDPSQTLNMFLVCVGLYFGRKFQKDEKGAIIIEEPTKKE